MNSVLQYVLYVGILVAVAIQWPHRYTVRPLLVCPR